ncbi:threonine transporter RhtB [Pelagibacterium lentulum]|uniref:Threonine transporter RhtB n=2 Tax=Pelagibacterium lentulum TaxID=2029865 RepID=A0A916RK37_9HYPH|nr:LysE family translocator [Pelagibacterium lentulum]GGA58396.1 threonine transporter RhtB [Pelagibacterium lentulum]
MLSLPTLATFFVTALAIELTPGPNMAYLALLSAERGRRPGLFAVAGVTLGLAIIGLLAALGLAAIIAQNQLAYQAVRWAGILYLVWLGYDSWRDAQKPVGQEDYSARSHIYFRRGLITNLLNPKAAVFYLAVLPNFLPAQASVASFILLAAIYVFAATFVHTMIVVLASQLQPFFVQPERRRTLGAIFGLLLVGVAIWLGLSTRQV